MTIMTVATIQEVGHPTPIHIVTIDAIDTHPTHPPSPPMFRRTEVDRQGENHELLPVDGQKIMSKFGCE